MRMPMDEAIADEVLEELFKATAKFPMFVSGHEGYAILLEEVEELKAHVFKQHDVLDRKQEMRKEAIQVAAMAIRFVRDVCE